MSKLVEKYIELSKKGFSAESEEKMDKIADEMDAVKKQFTESDWDELIASVPVHIRPLLKKQKEEFLK